MRLFLACLFLSSTAFAEEKVVVDLNSLQWKAYRGDVLVKSGKAVGGAKKCLESRKSCKTPAGVYKMIRKYGGKYKSNIYPKDCEDLKECGAKMPYFIRLTKDGVGLHGSDSLPNYNASHGCVRLHPKDARWLNKHFVTKETVIEVLPY